MKMMSQIEAWKSIRKAALPQNRIEQPRKGGGYTRKEKHRKPYSE